MAKVQTFKLKREALAEIRTMRGWEAKAVKMLVQDEDSPDPNKTAHRWVIECKEPGKEFVKYLRVDGFVN